MGDFFGKGLCCRGYRDIFINTSGVDCFCVSNRGKKHFKRYLYMCRCSLGFFFFTLLKPVSTCVPGASLFQPVCLLRPVFVWNLTLPPKLTPSLIQPGSALQNLFSKFYSLTFSLVCLSCSFGSNMAQLNTSQRER